MSTDKLVLNDMTPESLIRYAHDCLDKWLQKGWKFDWREYTSPNKMTCCLSGAIRLQNQAAFDVAFFVKSNNVTKMSSACRLAQRRFGLEGYQHLPTPDQILSCWGEAADVRGADTEITTRL